ncbi:MAG TPA: hypothetical protein VEL07_11980 [Planctomycetota bacterium]|nr:hypothetical protein [Planctomycetota bacterium]
MNGGWSLDAVGLPIWLCLPLAILAAWGIGRLAWRELSRQPPRSAGRIAWLRPGAVAVLIVLLAEPTLTRTQVDGELPAVAVLVDRSGSMAVDDRQMAATHRLDEAVALGLIDPQLRPDAGSRAARGLDLFAADLPAIARALAGARDAWVRGESVDQDAQAITAGELARARSADARDLATRSATLAGFPELFNEGARVLALAAAALAKPRAEITAAPAGERPEALIAALDAVAQRARDARGQAEREQEAADAALVASLEAGSPIAAGLEQLAGLGRWQRALRFVERTLQPALAGKAEVRLFALDEELGELSSDTTSPPDERDGTDFAAPLARLARDWSDRHVGAVVVLSDGRQTAGGDATPLAQALRARGALVGGIVVGDPRAPRDAVVAEIAGSQEVFRGERIRLDVRLRIVGFDNADFDLVLLRDGTEVERRAVRGTGVWQSARFDRPAEDGGVHVFQARLEPAPTPAQQAVAMRGGLTRETWLAVPGAELAALSEHGAWQRAPDQAGLVAEARVATPEPDSGTRLRGWIMPPTTGVYVFSLTGDDQCDLQLSTDADPGRRRRVAFVPALVGADEWQKHPEQTSEPVTLSAGVPYYLEAIGKNGAGAGALAVGWKRPDGQVERPVPGAHLAPWRDGPPPRGAVDQVEASLANNHAEFTVTVNDDPLRVLLVDSTPRWDSRYLVAMLERDRRVQVTRRYRSIIAVVPDAQRLLPATQAELDAFDLVVIGDLASSDCSPAEQAMLAQFVTRRGGFLIAMAGTRGMPASYPLGALAEILPVRAGPRPPASEPVALMLAKGGADHPIIGVLDDAKLNQRLWPALPRITWHASTVTAKAGATVLLEANDARRAPVVAVQRHGAGRVLWVGTDETWRWRSSLGDRVHQTFWLQAVRWGLGARLRGRDPRLQVALDRALLEPGEGSELRARARLADGTPVVDHALTVRIERLDDQGQPQPGVRQDVELARVADADLWATQFSRLGEGRYRLSVGCAHPELAGMTEAREVIVRRARSVEGIELGTDAPFMAHLAEAGGFRSADLRHGDALVGELAEQLKPKSRAQVAVTTLWDNYLALSLVLGLLLGEWILRKRRGLP